MDEKFALLFWSEFSVGGGGSGGGGNGGASASGGGGGGGAAAAEFTHQVNYGIQAAVLILYTESFFEALKLEAFSVIGVSCGETRCFAACQFSPAPFYFLLCDPRSAARPSLWSSSCTETRQGCQSQLFRQIPQSNAITFSNRSPTRGPPSFGTTLSPSGAGSPSWCPTRFPGATSLRR